jgi:uncharacterized protein (TIGR02145 family)
MKLTKILLVFSTFLLNHAFSQTIKDIDGNVYKTTTINKMQWMTSNLAVKKFNNGEKITHAQSEQEWLFASANKTAAWCYYEDENGIDTKTILYNWYAVVDPRGLAPVGSHVPSTIEWKGFINSLGGVMDTPRKIVSKTGWETNQKYEEHVANAFNAKPVGSRYVNLTPMSHWYDGQSKGKYTNFWTSTSWNEKSTNDYAYRIGLAYNYPTIIHEMGDNFAGTLNLKGNGYSVRCVLDFIP